MLAPRMTAPNGALLLAVGLGTWLMLSSAAGAGNGADAAAAVGTSQPPSAGAESSSDLALGLRVTLYTPLEGALLAASDDRVFVAGRAVTFAPQAEHFDLVV